MSGSISATVIRATRLDAAGAAVTGTNAYIVSEGFVRITATPRYTESPSTVILDIWGDVVANEPENPEMLGVGSSVGLIGVDPGPRRVPRRRLHTHRRQRPDEPPGSRRPRHHRPTTRWKPGRMHSKGPTTASAPNGITGRSPTRARRGAVGVDVQGAASLEFTVSGYTQPALASWGDGPHDPAPGEAVTVGDFAVHSLTLVPPPEPTNGLASL